MELTSLLLKIIAPMHVYLPLEASSITNMLKDTLEHDTTEERSKQICLKTSANKEHLKLLTSQMPIGESMFNLCQDLLQIWPSIQVF